MTVVHAHLRISFEAREHSRVFHRGRLHDLAFDQQRNPSLRIGRAKTPRLASGRRRGLGRLWGLGGAPRFWLRVEGSRPVQIAQPWARLLRLGGFRDGLGGGTGRAGEMVLMANRAEIGAKPPVRRALRLLGRVEFRFARTRALGGLQVAALSQRLRGSPGVIKPLRDHDSLWDFGYASLQAEAGFLALEAPRLA